MARIEIKDLPAEAKQLSAQEMGQVTGGALIRSYGYERKMSWKTVYKMHKVPVVQARKFVQYSGKDFLGGWR